MLDRETKFIETFQSLSSVKQYALSLTKAKASTLPGLSYLRWKSKTRSLQVGGHCFPQLISVLFSRKPESCSTDTWTGENMEVGDDAITGWGGAREMRLIHYM